MTLEKFDNETKYNGGCDCMSFCRDIHSMELDPSNEDLKDQFYELCTSPDPICTLRKQYLIKN